MKISAIYKNASMTQKITCWIFAIVSLVFFYSYTYGDIVSTARMGITLWDNVFSGTIREFYRDRVYMTITAYAQDMWATYDFPIYIIFAIWNFPLWLLEHFAGVDVLNNALCMMWTKTMLLPFIYFLIQALYRVCTALKMEEEKARITCVLFLTSALFTSSVIVISQYDIIEMCFVLLGIAAYIQGNMKKFVLWFAVSIPLKYFALLLFVPLLLLREKRILWILWDTLKALGILILFRILIPFYGGYEDLNGNRVKRYPFEYTAHLGVDRVYLFILAFGMLLCVCYFIKLSSEQEYISYTLYTGFIVYFIQYSTMYTHPYWVIMFVPYICLIIVNNDRYFLVNLCLEMLMSIGLVFAQIFKFYWCFDSAIASGMFWPLILGKADSATPLSIVSFLSVMTDGNSDKIVEHAIGIGSTVFVGCGILFALLNCPVFKNEINVVQGDKTAVKWLLRIRILADMAIASVPLAFYIVNLIMA